MRSKCVKQMCIWPDPLANGFREKFRLLCCSPDLESVASNALKSQPVKHHENLWLLSYVVEYFLVLVVCVIIICGFIIYIITYMYWYITVDKHLE